MKYIYAIKYKEKTRYRVVVCTQGNRRIHLGYADTLVEAMKIRNKFFHIDNNALKREIQWTASSIKRIFGYDFMLNEKDFQKLKEIKSALEEMIKHY